MGMSKLWREVVDTCYGAGLIDPETFKSCVLALMDGLHDDERWCLAHETNCRNDLDVGTRVDIVSSVVGDLGALVVREALGSLVGIGCQGLSGEETFRRVNAKLKCLLAGVQEVLGVDKVDTELLNASKMCLIPAGEWVDTLDGWAVEKGYQAQVRLRVARNMPIIKAAALTVECIRFCFTFTWSWSLPSKVVLQKMKQVLGEIQILDIGCGTGYWSKCLVDCGCKSLAIEVDNPENPYVLKGGGGEKFTKVVTLSCQDIENRCKQPGCALLLAWVPPSESKQFALYVNAFNGEFVVFVDDGNIFHARGLEVRRSLTDNQFKLFFQAKLPSFPDRQDHIYFYARQG
mmetsp:Transcript_20414/g.33687  ORF Transcript_20414/g.33687 Transcript_20414/m.33687 type:complete len:346 (-) Transcript_20414:2217-3254(-)|eukprot:CAMPEP_0203763362 /NCGR_PEP_ID=MMETSP0098-20131031/16081_1 /ASSEMBLY_ACC=CAM_ASM_000208 /TAXON_ID=96639 /ORGANISM=" , Strain NY0313808BC1" /LENGTH=345 /DNA_ID=CAMNT_0050658111 /DNA_START=517 /DNA_END=1554 /DNA_ORIENTATION=+